MNLSASKLVPVIFLFGCSDYELTAVNKESVPVEDTALVMDIPVAVAGPSQRVKKHIPIQLDGSASYHPTNSSIFLNYEWVLTSGVPDANISFQDTQSASPYFSADKVGSYVAELNVTDSFEASSENFELNSITLIVSFSKTVKFEIFFFSFSFIFNLFKFISLIFLFEE